MKNIQLIIVLSFLLLTSALYSQISDQKELVDYPISNENYTSHNKGKFFVFWGGNRAAFTNSDIHFKGADYDFTLNDVEAQDKPKGWHVDYVNPGRMTIPQTNFRMGYFISDKYLVSLGVDHMKYVMKQDKRVTYTGFYPNPGSYDENPSNNQLDLTKKFLEFEHTDGLNYVHAEISRFDDISKFIGLPTTDKFQINVTEGIGTGIIYPKTNTTLLGKERHDDFNIAGFGLSAKAGLNFTFFKYFFIQTEIKGGYINMNNIKTTASNDDGASQHFLFIQHFIAVGGIFRL